MKSFVTGIRLIVSVLAVAMILATPSQAQVVINELHYHPEAPDDNAEFIELYNASGALVDISNWSLSGFANTPFVFPGGTELAAGEYVVVAHDIALLASVTGFTAVHEWPTGNLSNGGESVILSDDVATEVDSVTYGDSAPWPTTPDGDGPSLELLNPAFDNSYPRVWSGSIAANGTPGAQNSVFSNDPVVLFEDPPHLSIVQSLPQISVTFAEDVQFVTAGQLTVNGAAATSVTGTGAGPYDFSGFAAPVTAPITIELAGGTIEDLGGNSFGGDSWYHGNVVINEIHYHPGDDPADPDGDAEFIELLNAGTIPAEISGWQLDFGPLPYTFPGSTSIPAGGVVVVAKDAALLQTLTGFSTPYEWGAVGSLSNGGETITLSTGLGDEIDNVDYGDRNVPPWPAEPDGEGPSLELIHWSLDNALALAWQASSGPYGTPGAQNSAYDPGPIVISETPARGELIPPGLTQVSVTFHEAVTGLVAGDLIVDGAAASAVSGSGAGPYVFTIPAPSSDVVEVTLGAGSITDLDLNPFSGDAWQYVLNLPVVVINEIHYNPADAAVTLPEDAGRLQFLELYNPGTQTVNLTGWRVIDGVTFDFPGGTSIAPDGYIVLAEDSAFLQANGPAIPGGALVYDWDGGDLANGGERIRLTDGFGNTIDVVEYNDEGEWPDTPDAEGPSLELINPGLLNQFALAWEASTGTNGTPGAQNSTWSSSAPPVIALVSHAPAIQASAQPITVTARVSDTDPLFTFGTVRICSRLDQTPTIDYACQAMTNDGLGTFTASLPGLGDNQRMDYAVIASGSGGQTIAPREHDCGLDPFAPSCAGLSPSQTYLAQFSDDAIPNDHPSYHLVMTEAVRDAQSDHMGGGNRNSYDASVIQCQTDGSCTAFQNVIESYRGRGSINRHPHSYNIRFPNEPIQSEMGFEIRTLLLLGMNPHRQHLGHDAFHRAGHPASQTQFVRVIRKPAPHDGAGYADWLYLNAESVNDDFMSSQNGAVVPARFPDRCSVSDTVCDTDFDCPGGETCDVSTGGNLYRGRVDADLRFEGLTVGPPPCGGPYRLDCSVATPAGYQKITNEREDVWDELIALTDALDCSTGDGGAICTSGVYDEAWETALGEYLDIDQFLRWFALQNLFVNTEGGIYLNTGDDYFIGFQDGGEKARMITWDMDAITGSNTNDSIWRTNTAAVQRVLRHEPFAGIYIGEICRLLDNEFSVTEMNAVIDSIPEATFTQTQSVENQGNGPRTRQGMKDWVVNRHTGILNQLSTQTTLSGVPLSPYSDPDPVISLSGSLNQCGARRVVINGIEADSYNIGNVGGGGANWAFSYTLVPGINNIVVQTLAHDGSVIDSASDSVLYSPPGTGGGGPVALKVTGPTRMVNTKTYTVRAEILDSLGNTHWQTWSELGTVSAVRVSDGTPVPTSITVFETLNQGEGGGTPPADSIRFYNGLGSVSITLDDPVSVAGEAIRVTVSVAGFSDSVELTVLDETTPGLFKNLSGTISGADLIWNESDGVIRLTGNVTVSGTLQINPGTLIMGDPLSPGNGAGVTVNGSGSVQAIGTEANPIFFFATNGPPAMALPQTTQNNSQSWEGINHTSGGQTSNYSQVFVTGAGNGDVSGHPRPVILGMSGSHSVNITDCVFADNPGKAVHGSGSGNYYIARSLFSRAGIGGEFFGANHNLLIEDSWFTRNGRAPEPNNVDGDALHVDNGSATQLIRRVIIADCGDDAIDHSGSIPVIEDTIIWDVRDKAASLTGGGIVFDNVLVFRTGSGIRGGTGTVTVRNSTIAVGSSVSGSGSVTIDESILTSTPYTGACNGNVNYTLGPNSNHVACGTGNLSGSAGFQDPGECDYSLLGNSQASDAGPSGGRIGWLGFPDGALCSVDGDCDDGNACTADSCDAGACDFVPIDECTPCVVDSECDDGDPCTLETCGGGACTNPPGNDGATCDDTLTCTTGDVCDAGTCAGVVDCPAGQTCGVGGECLSAPSTLTFQDDGTYDGTQDTFLREADPGTVHGALDFFEWDLEDPAPSRNVGLLRFDGIVGPGAVPLGSTVTQATLTVVVTDPSVADGEIYLSLVDWDQATASWNNFGVDPGVQPGEQGALIALAPFSVGTHVIDITSAAQGWVDSPATNYGLIFVPTSTNGTIVSSSEFATIADRPLLTIDIQAASCTQDSECNNGLFCDGSETCDLGSGTCQVGIAPSCDDGVTCTTDSCNETNDTCTNTPVNSACDDGSYCNGTETCDAALDCQAGTAPDCSGQFCSDPLEQCVECLSDTDCTGADVCSPSTGTCAPPAPVDPLPIVLGDEFDYFKGTTEPSPGGGGEATTDWTLLSFDVSSWLAGPSGFGYGTAAHEIAPEIATELDDMAGNYASVYVRREFHVPNPAAVDTLTLSVAYDDAFVAYLNGVEVVRTEMLLGLGDPPTFDQLASNGPTNHEGDVVEVFDLAAAIPQLVSGTNVLAIQAHNVTLTSSDLVLKPELAATFINTTCTTDAECDDLLFCNGLETCGTGGTCESGTPPDCSDDGVNCTADTCDEDADACAYVPNDAVCDDGNECTDNTCNPVTGCVVANNTATCDDADACTVGETCSGGSCGAGAPLDCDDDVDCTIDTCDTALGCQYEADCPAGEVCNVALDVCEVQSGPLAGDVIISGFQANGTNVEWIELFNTTGQAISLEDLNFVARMDVQPDGTVGVDWDFAAVSAPDLTGLTIAPYSFYLFGETGVSNADFQAPLDLATGEGGTDERAISLELTLGGVHLDYVVYGRHDGADSAAIPPGDLSFAGAYPRAEVIRTVTGTLPIPSFNEGATQRVSAIDLFSGHDVEGYYTDEASLPGSFPAGVWTSAHATTGGGPPRDSTSPQVLPPTPDCTVDADCIDGLACNGDETCDIGSGQCQPGVPIDCDDLVACTTDSCNETTDACEHTLCSMSVAAVGGRYLAVTPPAGVSSVALRVDSAGVSCLPQYVDVTGELVGTPVFQSSAAWGTVFVGDREILPQTLYEVSAEVSGSAVIGEGSATTWIWGDANNVDGAELFDMLCVSDGFANIFTQCTLEGDDVKAGVPDRAIDLDDLLAVLDGVALVPYPDADPCVGPPPLASAPTIVVDSVTGSRVALGEARTNKSALATGSQDNLITLVPRAAVVQAGTQFAVDVFVSRTLDLRGYQIALEVDGGLAGALAAGELVIDTERDDYVFASSTSVPLTDRAGLRLAAALPEGGVDAHDPVYLGTFVFVASDDAKGDFMIDFSETRTFLRDRLSGALEHRLGQALKIRVPVRSEPRVDPPTPLGEQVPVNDLQRSRDGNTP